MDLFWSPLCSPRLHLFDENYSKNTNIVTLNLNTYVRLSLELCWRGPTESTSSDQERTRTLIDPPPMRSCSWHMDVSSICTMYTLRHFTARLNNSPITMYSLHADMRGFMTAHGQPDQSRSARYVLKDYVCVSAFHLLLPVLLHLKKIEYHEKGQYFLSLISESATHILLRV